MEKLLESGDAVDTRNRYLAHFLEFSRQAEEHFVTAQRPMWSRRFELEHDNLRSALGWAVESQPESALQMVGSLGIFWLSRSYMTEGCKWCQAALSRAEALSLVGPEIDHARTRAFSALAMLSINHGEHRTGQIAAREAVALARKIEDPLQLARALNFLGMSAAFSGDERLAFDSSMKAKPSAANLGTRMTSPRFCNLSPMQRSRSMDQKMKH